MLTRARSMFQKRQIPCPELRREVTSVILGAEFGRWRVSWLLAMQFESISRPPSDSPLWRRGMSSAPGGLAALKQLQVGSGRSWPPSPLRLGRASDLTRDFTTDLDQVRSSASRARSRPHRETRLKLISGKSYKNSHKIKSPELELGLAQNTRRLGGGHFCFE